MIKNRNELVLNLVLYGAITLMVLSIVIVVGEVISLDQESGVSFSMDYKWGDCSCYARESQYIQSCMDFQDVCDQKMGYWKNLTVVKG